MQALDLLLNRYSNSKLQEPAPQDQELKNIMQAALKAPDHAALTPWRFIVCQGEGLVKLGELYRQAAVAENMSERDLQRASQLPLRAPMLIIAIAKYQQHPKVPRVEQIASASCAVQAMQMTALAQGYNGIWRTGAYAHSQHVKTSLGLSTDDEIIGYLYLGTEATEVVKRPSKDSADYFEFWS